MCSSYSRVHQKVWRSLHHKWWWFSHEVVSNSFATPWTVAHQAPLPMGFFRQEYWSGLPFPSPGDLPNPGIKPVFPALAGGFFTTEPPGKLYYPFNVHRIYSYVPSFISTISDMCTYFSLAWQRLIRFIDIFKEPTSFFTESTFVFTNFLY